MKKFYIELAITLFLALVIYIWSNNGNIDYIDSTIANRGGSVISIEQREWNIGPFYTKYNNIIYKI